MKRLLMSLVLFTMFFMGCREGDTYVTSSDNRLTSQECTSDSDCDDGIFCTGVEICNINGVCVLGPLPCSAGESCNETNHVCTITAVCGNHICETGETAQNCADDCTPRTGCMSNPDCDDNKFCNGLEACDINGICRAGVSPCLASEFCDEANKKCSECQAGITVPCDTGYHGVCSQGVKKCGATGTFLACVQTTSLGPEICHDGLDNDCDGDIDESDCYLFDTHGSFSLAALDSTNPAKQLIIANDKQVLVLAVKLQADFVEDLDLNQAKITDMAAISVPACAWYLYSSARSDGGSVNDPVAIAPSGPNANFFLLANSVNIRANTSVVLTVKIDVGAIDGVNLWNSMGFWPEILFNTDVRATGKNSNQYINISTAPIVADYGPSFIMGSRPYFYINASSPSGVLIPGANTLLAIFNVRADDADDISFVNASGNFINFNISSNNLAGIGNFMVKDETSTVLDSGAVVVGGVLRIDFDSADFVIAKGQAKKLYLYANTIGLTNPGDLAQVWLDDSEKGNINWSINYDGGNYQHADIIFRGGIYAGNLIVP